MQGWQLLNEEINGEHSWLFEYYKKCKSGIIIIGMELMTALDMYIEDIHSPEFRFCLSKPHKRIKFIETKLKHFEAPFAGKPFILTIEQKAIAEAVFGFEYYDPEYNEWVRRFTDILLLIGRKNGKTPFVGALILSEWFCGEKGAKVMCASNDYEQASIVFDCINNFREESRTIERVTRKNNSGIFFGNRKQKHAAGKFSKQNKGSIKKMSAKTGAKEGRNLKLVVTDEIHEMKDDSTVMPLRSSLTTQKEPLYFEITTEGIVNDGYLDDRLIDARKVLSGELSRPRWLIWLYTQDSEAEIWRDESTWVKSNPLLGVAKKWSYLRGLVEEARTSGTKRAFILAKEFNIKATRPNAWLDDVVIINESTFSLEEFRGNTCICGVDLSEVNDLSACTFYLCDQMTQLNICTQCILFPSQKHSTLFLQKVQAIRKKRIISNGATRDIVELSKEILLMMMLLLNLFGKCIKLMAYARIGLAMMNGMLKSLRNERVSILAKMCLYLLKCHPLLWTLLQEPSKMIYATNI